MEEAARDTKYVKWVLSRKSPGGGLAKFVAYLQDNDEHQATIDHGQSEAGDAWIEHCIEHSIETDQDDFDDEYDLQVGVIETPLKPLSVLGPGVPSAF